MQRITAYLFSTVFRSSSNLHKIFSQTALHAYLDDISVQRAARANLRADITLSGEAHSFEITAVQSHPQVFSDVFEAYFDPKPSDSAAGPLTALEAVEASGCLGCILCIQVWSFGEHNHSPFESEVPSVTGTQPKIYWRVLLENEQKIYQDHRYLSLNHSLFGSVLMQH